jgi:hypothetical protein
MQQDGFSGMFGLDFIVKEDGSHFFIEINARQPASIPMYSKIQLAQKQIPLALLHLAEFLEIDYMIDIEQYNFENLKPVNFSQIFIRAPKDCQIRCRLQAGIYRLQGDNAGYDPVKQSVTPDTIFLDEQRDKSLIFQKNSYSIHDFSAGPGMLILTQRAGRIIKANEEFARMQINSNALLASGELKGWIVEVLKAVYSYQM